MKLPIAPPAYARDNEARTRAELEKEDGRNRKAGADVLVINGERVVLISPNGTTYALAVNNAGVLSTVAVTL